MYLNRLWVVFKSHLVLLLPAGFFLIGCSWTVATLYYSWRIDILHEQVNLLDVKNDFLEGKLRDIERVTTFTPKDSQSLAQNKKALSSLRYPAISDPKKLSREDVKKLASFYDLTKSWSTNPQLKMKDGDISYWYEQGLSENELKREFESRRLALEEAEKNHQIIDTQGDLSHLAQKIQARLLPR